MIISFSFEKNKYFSGQMVKNPSFKSFLESIKHFQEWIFCDFICSRNQQISIKYFLLEILYPNVFEFFQGVKDEKITHRYSILLFYQGESFVGFDI